MRIEKKDARQGGDEAEPARREGVDAQAPVDLQLAGNDPWKERHAAVVMAKADIGEGQPRQQHGGEKEDRGDELRGTRAGGRRFERLWLRPPRLQNSMPPLRRPAHAATR